VAQKKRFTHAATTIDESERRARSSQQLAQGVARGIAVNKSSRRHNDECTLL